MTDTEQIPRPRLVAKLHERREQGERAKQKASDTTTTQEVLTGVAVALGAAAVVAWGAAEDIPVAPV